MNTLRFIPSRLAAACLLGAAAASSHALGLAESYERALAHDPATLAADQALAAGREKAVQGRALLLPQVALSASVAYANDRSSTANLPAQFQPLVKSDASGSTHQAAVQLMQPIYDAKARADQQQLVQMSELAQINHRHALQELMQKVSEACLDVLLAQETVRVVQAEKAAVGMQRDRAKARFEVGRGKVTDVQEAQARYDGVLTRELSAQSTLALQQARYRELTGADADALAAALAGLRGGFVPAPPRPDSLAEWQSRGVERNVRVLAKRSELVAASAEIDKYRLAGRPTLDLVATYTVKGQGGGLASSLTPDASRTAALGLQFNVPLYAGGAIDSKQRESIAKRAQTEQELSAAQRDTRLQVQDAFLAVKTGVARVASLEQSVLSAQTALEATTLGRDIGSRTELDVLDAQQRLFTQQLDLAQARRDYLLGRVKLAAAAGELQEGDLHALDATLAR